MTTTSAQDETDQGSTSADATRTIGAHVGRHPRRRSSNLSGLLFISPWLVGFVFLTLVPVVSVLLLGFTRYNILSPPRWIGFTNFLDLFTQDPRYWHSVRATVYYAFTSVPLSLVFSLVLALILNAKRGGVAVYRAVFYVPSVVGGSVAVAVMWREIFGASGLVNGLLSLVHIPHNQSWLGDPATAIWTLILLAVWQFGSPMLIFLAGLKQIPIELYECAQIDGARKPAMFWRITLPLLTPIILFNLVLQMIFGLTVFGPAFIITGGAPLDTTNFYALYLYEQAFNNFQMGYGSAMAFVLLIAIAIVTAIIFKTSPYWVFYRQTEGK